MSLHKYIRVNMEKSVNLNLQPKQDKRDPEEEIAKTKPKPICGLEPGEKPLQS